MSVFAVAVAVAAVSVVALPDTTPSPTHIPHAPAAAHQRPQAHLAQYKSEVSEGHHRAKGGDLYHAGQKAQHHLDKLVHDDYYDDGDWDAMRVFPTSCEACASYKDSHWCPGEMSCFVPVRKEHYTYAPDSSSSSAPTVDPPKHSPHQSKEAHGPEEYKEPRFAHHDVDDPDTVDSKGKHHHGHKYHRKKAHKFIRRRPHAHLLAELSEGRVASEFLQDAPIGQREKQLRRVRGPIVDPFSDELLRADARQSAIERGIAFDKYQSDADLFHVTEGMKKAVRKEKAARGESDRKWVHRSAAYRATDWTCNAACGPPCTVASSCYATLNTSCGNCVFAGGRWNQNTEWCHLPGDLELCSPHKDGSVCAVAMEDCEPCGRFQPGMQCPLQLLTVAFCLLTFFFFIVAVAWSVVAGHQQMRREQDFMTAVKAAQEEADRDRDHDDMDSHPLLHVQTPLDDDDE